MNTERSTTLNAILKIAPEIFGVGKMEKYARSYDRANDPEFAGLLSFKADVPGPKKPTLVMPFMYQDRIKTPTNLLRSETIVKVRAWSSMRFYTVH